MMPVYGNYIFLVIIIIFILFIYQTCSNILKNATITLMNDKIEQEIDTNHVSEEGEMVDDHFGIYDENYGSFLESEGERKIKKKSIILSRILMCWSFWERQRVKKSMKAISNGEKTTTPPSASFSAPTGTKRWSGILFYILVRSWFHGGRTASKSVFQDF